MKKSLFALAAMGAFVGAAHAQSSVTVSGLVEAGYTSKSIRAATAGTTEVTQSAVTGGHVATPVVRIQGSEDLGGGTRAGFSITDEFNTNSGARSAGTTGIFTESLISLSNTQFGTLSAGKMYHATRDLGGVYRFMGDIGRIAGSLNSSVAANSVQYVSPSLQGFSASIGYASNGKTTDTGTTIDTNIVPASLFSIGLRGAIGKANLAVSMETSAFASTTSAPNDQAKQTITSVGGGYDFGMAKLGAAYFDQKSTLATGADGGKRVAYTVNLAAPVTKVITLGASYANYEVTLAAGGAKPKATIMTFGAQYALSKRTSIYGSYQLVTNSGADNALQAAAAGGINASTTAGSSRGLGVQEINGGSGRGFGLTAVHTF
jgi:predicted porin